MANFCNLGKEGCEVEKVPSGFGAPRSPHVSAHGVLHSGWQPSLQRTVLSLHGSGSSVASAGQLTTRATSTGCADIAHIRGASSPSNAHTVWRRVPSALRWPLTSRGKVSFFYVLSISCKYWCPNVVLTLFRPFSRHRTTAL